jgi:hypothetical protein
VRRCVLAGSAANSPASRRAHAETSSAISADAWAATIA